MDNDLERSLQILEEALAFPQRTPVKPIKKHPDTEQLLHFTELKDMTPTEYQLKSSHYSSVLESTVTKSSVLGAVVQADTTWRNAVDSLFWRFLEVLQSCQPMDILEVVTDLARCCSDALSVLRHLQAQVQSPVGAVEAGWLEAECNTWRLLYVLYTDRLRVRDLEDENLTLEKAYHSGTSEQRCVEVLFRREHVLRECQLISDWLEKNALERDDPILHQVDWTYGWEHTIHQLAAPESVVIPSQSGDLVTELHPDVPFEEDGKKLHHLDEANEKRLDYRVFMEIRCGQLEQAQKLLCKCGHPWKAFMLEGWKLYHSPNAEDEDQNETTGQKLYKDFKGNANRDLWKCTALDFCQQDEIHIYERASIAAFCGSLDTLLKVSKTWEDYLWAYVRTLVDIRVEEEIRTMISKEEYVELPEEYWSNKMSLNDVFNTLEACPIETVRTSCSDRFRLIQKYVILENISGLIGQFAEWVNEEHLSMHFLRFLTHLVFFFSHTEGGDKKQCEKIVEAYIARLSRLNRTQMVAFYCSKLSGRKQIVNYARHLETIANTERKAAIGYGEDFALEMTAVTVLIVENVRNRPLTAPTVDGFSNKITVDDETMVSALDWLLFYEDQLLEAVLQSNQMIFTFLTLGKLEAAQLALLKIPSDVLSRFRHNDDDVNEDISLVIKEHLCYKTYLDAQEAFNKWFTKFQKKPIAPPHLDEIAASFTEKVAHEHLMEQFSVELKKWQMSVDYAAKTAKGLLYNVLVFPDGWLMGTENADYLRCVCIPEVCLLLYTVLYEMQLYTEAIQLADLVASEVHSLYKAFSQDKLAEFLEKLTECSLALLNSKKDPWGQDSNA